MKTALELIAEELQNVMLADSDIARAVALAKQTNEKVRRAADARLQFEDEPAAYLGFLHAQP